MAGQQRLSIPTEVRHPGGELPGGVEWIRRKQGLTERLSDGVGACAMAPGLPPTGDNGVESEAAHTHEAWKEWNSLVRRRRVGAMRRRCGMWCRRFDVSAVAGVVWGEVVSRVPRSRRRGGELQSES